MLLQVDVGNSYFLMLLDSINRIDKILGEAGVGTFGRVLECTDQKTSQIVAIKVVRSIQKYTDSATIEARILEEVNRRDEGSDSLCVQLYKRFIHEGHMCLVFEKLGCSLYDYLKNHDYHPFPFPAVRHFAYQLLKSLVRDQHLSE